MIALAGCQRTVSEEEQGKIATAYGEMLIAKNMASGDSAAVKKMVDSVLKVHGFNDENALLEEIRVVSANPDHLRVVLDSTQRLLEEAQRGTANKMQ